MRTFTRLTLLSIIGGVLLGYASPLLAWGWQQPLHAGLTALGLLAAVVLAWAADGKIHH